MSKAKYQVKDSTVNFIKKWMPEEKLKSFLPLTKDNRWDFLDFFDHLEASWVNDQESGLKYDKEALDEIPSIIDELNTPELNLSDLTERLK